ncbi:hypothetical protein NEDG_00895 [Nematocida displodere]|uniref:Protein BCP1 n=1 Tax=Nematocida displodere TaxID=1805483 RepID=A0A177EF57_9MICR|nr:hypothetical protein NEDG_00895 [Nematocida displodere]
MTRRTDSASSSASESSSQSLSETDSAEDLGTDISTSSEENSQLFSIVTGTVSGDYDRIELLLSQIKTLDASKITEEIKEKIFEGVVIRSEAETTEEDPWITSIISLLPYPVLAKALLPRAQKEMAKLSPEELEDAQVLLSLRFKNVPENVVLEMFASLPQCLKVKKHALILFLSAEAPLDPDHEKELQSAFPDLQMAKLKDTFPHYPEEVFFQISKIKPGFVSGSGECMVKGYLLTEDSLSVFIKALKDYYETE